MKKIILKENESVSNEIINNAKTAISNGKKLISMLDRLGLTVVDEVSDWQAISDKFTKDYPKATLTFNLKANGIEGPYREAEAFYLKHRHALRFETLTEAEIEAIKEEHRVYAAGSQIEAIELFNTVKDSLLRLQEMGVKLDLNHIYDISKVFRYDPRQKPAVTIEPTALYHNLINLK